MKEELPQPIKELIEQYNLFLDEDLISVEEHQELIEDLVNDSYINKLLETENIKISVAAIAEAIRKAAGVMP